MNIDIIPKIKEICIIMIKSVYGLLDPNRRDNSFEVLFLIRYLA
jgi:hypothetical protein